MAHIRHTDFTPEDIEAQIKWENMAVEEGARRFRESLEDTGIGNSTIGQTLMQRTLKPLYEKIIEAQQEAFDIETQPGGGKRPAWCKPILTLSPDKLAVIILQAVFNTAPREGMVSFPVTRVARNLSSAAQMQVDFDLWEEEMKREKKETKERTELDHYLSRTKQISAKSFDRFSQKIQRTKLEKWPRASGRAFGAKCIKLLKEARPDWFSVSTIKIEHGKTEIHLVFSEECKEVMLNLIERSAVMSPRLMPTLIPPKRWVRKDT